MSQSGASGALYNPLGVLSTAIRGAGLASHTAASASAHAQQRTTPTAADVTARRVSTSAAKSSSPAKVGAHTPSRSVKTALTAEATTDFVGAQLRDDLFGHLIHAVRQLVHELLARW